MPITFGTPEANQIRQQDRSRRVPETPPLPTAEEWICDAEDLLKRVRRISGIPVGLCNQIDDLLECRMSINW